MTVILWFHDLRLLWNFFLEKLRELSSWTVRRSNQSILKEINPEYSLQGLILKLKIQYFGHLMWRANSLEKTLMLGKIEGKGRGERGRDGWMASLTQWTWVWANSGRVWRIEEPGMLQSMRSQSRTRLSDWTRELSLVWLCLNPLLCFIVQSQFMPCVNSWLPWIGVYFQRSLYSNSRQLLHWSVQNWCVLSLWDILLQLPVSSTRLVHFSHLEVLGMMHWLSVAL